MRTMLIDRRELYSYNSRQSTTAWVNMEELYNAIEEGKDIHFMPNNGARAGSIGKVVEPELLLYKTDYYLGFKGKNFMVDYGTGKHIKTGIKSDYNNFSFMTDYEGELHHQFIKGAGPQKLSTIKSPDMFGNKISTGDWVIYVPKSRYSGSKLGFGKLVRLSEAGNAWVIPHGKSEEVQTEHSNSLIKFNMQDELNSTYALCGSLQDLNIKLLLELDVGENNNN